jgi:exopolysaccharide biosynthesis polyprenyl glycosylphosphotransferase
VTLWSITSRVVHQDDAANGRGFFGDVALTMATIGWLGLPMTAVSLALPRQLPLEDTALFVGVLVPAILLLRLSLVGISLWRSRPVADVIIAGVGPLGRLTGAEISEGESRRRVIGYLSFGHEKPSEPLQAPLLGALRDLEQTLREVVVDEVFFASTAADRGKEVQAAIRTCEKLGVPFALPACSYRLTRARPTSEEAVADGYAHFTMVHVTPLEQAAKRIFDIVVSAAALVILSPVMAVAAVLVKLTSPGPVLFRQERVGLLGRRFHMLKFRSMVANAEALKASLLSRNEQSGPVFKIKADPRVTRVGAFLRKYSIDELPQLVNVLRGDMSIVGPRPERPFFVEQFKHRIPSYMLRHKVKAGITGWAQVNGWRGNTSLEKRIEFDLYYIENWSLALDFKIMWLTVIRGLHKAA